MVAGVIPLDVERLVGGEPYSSRNMGQIREVTANVREFEPHSESRPGILDSDGKLFNGQVSASLTGYEQVQSELTNTSFAKT